MVLASLTAIIFTFITLIFPHYFRIIFCSALAVSLAVFAVFFVKRKFLYACLYVFLILFSVINPYRVYVNNELQAKNFVSESGGDKIQCTATVTDSSHYKSYSVLFADITHINGKKVEKNIPARIGSYAAKGISSGDKIEFSGYAQNSEDLSSLDFDTASYLRSKNVFVDISSAQIISSSSGKASFLSRIRLFSRDMIYNYVRNDYDYENSSVCYAMFAGDMDYVSQDTKQSFRKSGLTHVLCVSGMHLSIIAGMFFSLFSFLSLDKRTKCILIIIICCLYTFFTGCSLSTVRACIMCILSFIAMMSGKKADAYSSLFISLLIISMFSPYSILDISLILSFASCFGIITFSDTTHSKTASNIFSKALVCISDALISNLGAVVFTLPIVCYSFGGISNLSVISTFLVMIPCQYLLILLVILMLLFPLSFIAILEPILHAVGFLCAKLCSFLIFVSDSFAGLKHSYTYLDRGTSQVVLCIFTVCVVILSLFVAFGLKRGVHICIIAIINLGLFLSFHSLYASIRHDSTYSLSYFRQNAEDRQLSIRLPRHGYLIVNADSLICDNKYLTEFDTVGGNNYLLLLPDKDTDTDILASSVKTFGERYGTKAIFTPDTSDGRKLAAALSEYEISCSFMPQSINFGNTQIDFIFADYYRITVNDGKTKSAVVFAQEYSKDYFDENNDICAFFTRETKNQFDFESDTKPDCSIFYTRIPKTAQVDGIYNTFNKKNFYIKE